MPHPTRASLPSLLATGACLAALALAPVAAAAAGPVSGVYTTDDGSTFEPADAIAFSRQEYGQPRVIVLLLDHAVDHAPLSRTLDVETAVEALTEEGSYLELEYDPAGEWQGTSFTSRYEGGSSSGSYYRGELAEARRVRIADGKVSGNLFGGKLTLAVPLVAPPSGETLPAGGGEPGKAVVACNAAFHNKDRAAVGRSCDTFLGEVIDSALRMRSEGYEWDDPWTPNGAGTCQVASLTDLQVRGGTMAGDEARVEVRGIWAGEGDPRTCGGPVFLRREAGAWKVTASRLDDVPSEQPAVE